MKTLSLTICFLAAFLVRLGNGDFSVHYDVPNISELTAEEAELLNMALMESATQWESIVLGHQEQDNLEFDIEVVLTTSGLASARPDKTVNGDVFTYPTSGLIWMNRNQIVSATNGLGIADGVDILTELMMHETAHAFGFGTLWRQNGLYIPGSGQYVGRWGLAAYQEEFDPEAEWIPVELAGASSSANAHWDQLLRSSSQEGNPQDPLSLSPLVGITDMAGRDLGLTLMSAALDPDHGEPFLSLTTVQSLRDLGFEVVPEPTGVSVFALALLGCLCGRMRKR